MKINTKDIKFKKIKENTLADKSVGQSPNVYGVYYKGVKLGEVEHLITQYAHPVELNWYGTMFRDESDIDNYIWREMDTSSISWRRRGDVAETMAKRYESALIKLKKS